MLIHRYFWPDTPPYAAMLRSIGKKLADEGHEVVVLSSQPSYKSDFLLKEQSAVENIDGMTINRVSLFREQGRHVIFRLMNMVYFPLRILLFSLTKKKFDIIMASTAPPVVVGFSAALGARMTGAVFFYHCMDIHPEIGRISGEFRNPVVFSLLRRLDSISCRIAKRVIVLSEDMRQSLLIRPGYDQDNIQVINNFSMPHHDVAIDVDPELLKQSDRFRIIFAGNIGRFQGLEAFIDAMEMLTHRSMIELVFVGEGSALSALEKRANGASNVKFLPHQSVNVARRMIADADLGIVSLSRDIYRYAYPSKTMTYLEEGCPLLVSVEHASELVKFVESSNVGVCVMPEQPKSIADAIESIYLDPQRHGQMKATAKQVSKEIFSERSVINNWTTLFNSSVLEKK
ncbi:MAG: glycosyltransferase family 4 protein [Gammaproteobacteria bacterium]|nr:glycosyltransferase family 4 protein [Gammaproteobacteria bacterium]